MATKKKAAQPASAAKKPAAKKAPAKKSAPAKKAQAAKKAPAKKVAAPAVKIEIPNDLVWADTKPAEVTEAVQAVTKLGFWKRLLKRA